MSEPFYVARVRVEKLASLQRRAHLELGPPIEMGVHGPVVGHFKLSPDRELPLPVDFIAAATGG
ncbi:MAG: hypothetical protein ACRENS_04715 [Candidatus Eiseniibacteriota bacterium]